MKAVIVTGPVPRAHDAGVAAIQVWNFVRPSNNFFTTIGRGCRERLGRRVTLGAFLASPGW
jgi:hypothetical protein